MYYKIKDSQKSVLVISICQTYQWSSSAWTWWGPIHPPSSRGNKYVLTVIDMLTGFTMAVPIKNKNAETICDAYRSHVYCTFGGSSRILTDNGSEFKNQEMRQVCETLGVKHIFPPVYTPESNGCLE